MIDNLLSETAFVRLLLRGDWGAELEPGSWTNVGRGVFFGPNSKPMRVRVRGGFRVVGIAFCPAGWRALSDIPAIEYVDRMLPLSEVWREFSDVMIDEIDAVVEDDEAGDERIVATIERHVRMILDQRGWLAAEPVMRRFEEIARNRSVMAIPDIADELGLSRRRLERMCKAHFGMSPKAVLRRSRFLDMASALRGLSQPDETELAALRYYDQSHLIREFRHFAGMTSGKFAKAPTPLLTAGLELRNLRKAQDRAHARG